MVHRSGLFLKLKQPASGRGTQTCAQAHAHACTALSRHSARTLATGGRHIIHLVLEARTQLGVLHMSCSSK